MHDHDLVIRNGTVVDGSGGPPCRPAPRTSPSTASASRPSGRSTARAREIDAEGKVVTPGFVDIHTHYDGQATWDPDMTPSSWHGVTTVVMGNCGVGFAPADPAKREWLIQLMEGVEDIPGTALAEGMSWNWETFPEYLDELDRLPASWTSARRSPTAPCAYVMGDRRRPERRGHPRRDRGHGQGRRARRSRPAPSASRPPARSCTGPRTASWLPAPPPAPTS